MNEIKRDLHEMDILVKPKSMQNKHVEGDPRYETLELQNYTFTILDTSDKDNMPKATVVWCLAEFKERVSGDLDNPGYAWEQRKEVWTEFLNQDGCFDYTYDERISGYEQLSAVIEELKRNPDSRQCIIHIHYPSDIYEIGGKSRIPCTMYYQFMVRRGALDVIYNMRSSDYNTHFQNDVWLADELRRFIAQKIQYPVGLFMMNVGSLHIYRGYNNDEHVF